MDLTFDDPSKYSREAKAIVATLNTLTGNELQEIIAEATFALYLSNKRSKTAIAKRKQFKLIESEK